MRRSTIILSALIGATLLLSSCRDNPIDWFNGGNNGNGTGSVTGKVVLQNGEYPSAPIPLPVNSYGGVRVSLDGTNLSTTTASDGSWSINKVPQGVYDIRFFKDGFGPQVIRSWQFIGTGEVELSPQPLCALPEAKLGGIDIKTTPGSGSFLRLVVEPGTPTGKGTPYHVVFFGKDANVSHRPGTYSHYLYQPWPYLSLAPHFAGGDRVYAVAYPVTGCDIDLPVLVPATGKDPADFQEYFDILEDGKSEVVSFVY